MSILTRLTAVFAQRMLPSTRYVVTMPVNSADTDSMPVFLTFDDGPHPDYTPRVLDQLSAINAKATFFVLGKYAKRYPEIVKRTLSEGHSIGTHSWSHLSARQVPVAEWIEDVIRARREVEDLIGQQCTIFRPPYGELTPLSLIAVLRKGIRVVQWSQDTKDFEAESVSKFRQWFASNQPIPGTIVLMHDNQILTCENLIDGCRIWQPGADFQAISMATPAAIKHNMARNAGGSA